MRIVIAGGSGFLGGALVDSLRADGQTNLWAGIQMGLDALRKVTLEEERVSACLLLPLCTCCLLTRGSKACRLVASAPFSSLLLMSTRLLLAPSLSLCLVQPPICTTIIAATYDGLLGGGVAHVELAVAPVVELLTAATRVAA